MRDTALRLAQGERKSFMKSRAIPLILSLSKGELVEALLATGRTLSDRHWS